MLSDEWIGSASRLLFDASTWRPRWLVNAPLGWFLGLQRSSNTVGAGSPLSRFGGIVVAIIVDRLPDTRRAKRKQRRGGQYNFASFGVALLMTAMSLIGSSSAQIVGKTLAQSVNHYDVAAIDPILQELLTDGKAGTVRDWSGSGKTGRVRLVSGGGSARCGRVRTSLTRGDHESRGYIFRYCRDPAGVWRTAG